MTNKTDKETVIQNYKDAHQLIHGRNIGVYQSSSWSHIGSRLGVYQLKDLARITDQLLEERQADAASGRGTNQEPATTDC
jgi:hypothetical protein